MTTLLAIDDELRELERGEPPLVDVDTGDTGITLERRVGQGGMSVVFRGRTAVSARSLPSVVAVKFLQAGTARRLTRLGMRPEELIRREVDAHESAMRVVPPTPNVVGCFGHGRAMVSIKRASGAAAAIELPWIALEYVDGGRAGTLEDRVATAAPSGPGGFDPARLLRLVRGLTAGVEVLHHHARPAVIHRDLKPLNILMTGPVDDETPKIADFGIARLQGLDGKSTVNGADLAYAPFEQLCGVPGEKNPLIGPWTDVHALAAVIWFAVTGQHWSAEAGEVPWRRGERPSLMGSRTMHPAVQREESLVARIQTVLARGASARLPEEVDARSLGDSGAAARFAHALPNLEGPARFADVRAFGGALLPLLQELDDAVRRRASESGALSPTLFRPTQLLRTFAGPLAEAQVVVNAVSPVAAIEDGAFVAAPGAGGLARLGGELRFLSGDRSIAVPLEAAAKAALAEARWLLRAPKGFAAIGERVLLVEHGTVTLGNLPGRPGAVGAVQAAHGDASGLLVVTAETDDTEGPELWRSSDGISWSGPRVLEQGPKRVHALAPGPGGILVVGGNKKGDRAAACVLRFDDTVTKMTVPEAGALRVALCGTGVDAWAAGDGFTLRFHVKNASPAETERVEKGGTPVAFGLDPIGIPWLCTTHAVLRRHIEGVEPVWRVYYERREGEPALLGIGFEARAVILLDAGGGLVRLTPHDAASWDSAAGPSTG